MNTFNENVVNEAILPEVEDRLGDIRKRKGQFLSFVKLQPDLEPSLNELELVGFGVDFVFQ